MQLEEGAVVVPPGTAFVSYEEVKQSVGAKKVLKVFLVDKEGRKHLAATGEDLGDAHYHYRTTKPFSKYGHIDCHNRKELTMWLEMVIAESGGKEGPHLDADEANPEGVYFTAYKYERAHMADGRRCNRWYLVDQHGASHLAVIGIERDTKDGHYAYTAEEPFASISPLNVSNQPSVFKWLENMVTHHAAGVDPHGQPALSNAAPSGGAAPSGSVNVPAANPSAVSAGGGGGAADGGSGGNNSTGPGVRKPPIIISLSAIRQARQQQSADAAAVHAAVPIDTAPGSGGPRVKAPPAKPKLSPQQQLVAAVQAQVQQQQAQQQMHHQMPPLMPQHHAMHSGPKQKSVGIVQQNQIKKARKLQDDVRAEQERLITAHLTRLRRAAAAEVQSDNNAKQVTLAWLQGALTEDELEALEHWLHLLTAVLDMQEQQQQAAAAGDVPQDQKQQQDGGGDASSAQAAAAAADEAGGGSGGGFSDKDLLSWLRQPDNARHHLRVVMECLKELGAADIPAKVLLQHKVVGLVHRSLAQNDHEAVQAMGKRILQRWQWQLAGHMQVLSNPVYMEDHGAALEDEIACGLVPLPQLPKHKLALLNTPLPVLPGAQHGGGGGGGGRSFYTPAGGGHSHIHQQQQQHAPGSAPAALDPIAAAAAAGLGRFGAAGFGQGLPVGSAAFPGLPGFYTPASAALLRAASPGALGGLMQPTLLFGQPGSGNQAQQLALMGQMQQQHQHHHHQHHLLPESGGVTGWPMAAAGVAAAAAQDASGGLPYGGGLAAGSSSDLAALAADATSVQQQQQAQVQAQAHQQQQLALLASWQQHQHQQNLAALLMLQQQTSAAAVAAASAPMLMNMPTSAPAEGQMPQHQQLLLQQHQQLVHWQQQQNHQQQNQQQNQQQQEPQPMQH